MRRQVEWARLGVDALDRVLAEAVHADATRAKARGLERFCAFWSVGLHFWDVAGRVLSKTLQVDPGEDCTLTTTDRRG